MRVNLPVTQHEFDFPEESMLVSSTDTKGIIVHWHSLREQFAQEYTGKDADKDFKKKFLPALRKVLATYPQAKVQQVRGGVLLNGSPPPIPLKGGPTK